MKLWREYVWETRLSPQQCAERLREATERDEFWRSRLGDPVDTLYRSGEFPFFHLRAPRSPLDRNPLEPNFQGRFVAHGGGTRVVGRFGISTFAIALLGVWFVMAIPLGATFAVAYLRMAVRHGEFGRFDVLVGAVLPLVGSALLLLTWRRSEQPRRRLEQFVPQIFEAEFVAGSEEGCT
ncbi:MAG TPA: hypothetical protein VF139_12825 [Candidatus Polarisedimenticolaceae bacterium]